MDFAAKIKLLGFSSLRRKLRLRKHKNNKLLYYLLNYVRQLIPRKFYQIRLNTKMKSLRDYDAEYIFNRVNYYNKLDKCHNYADHLPSLREFNRPKHLKVYYFDSYEYIRYFNSDLKVDFLFGDITYVPDVPKIVKSRPVNCDNANSVVLNLNKVRHFMYLKDSKPFTSKINMLVARTHVIQPHRMRFLEIYFNHPMCNIGQVNINENSDKWLVEKMTIDEHLDYKFILCIEGNDVASNLKWVMSSNSLAVMPKPKYETWFMEGALIPDYHYVLIKDDYSDLEERLSYYINNQAKALEIIRNAHEYVAQFMDKRREDLISLLVLDKYFKKTGQC
jgi:hypothetical protein